MGSVNAQEGGGRGSGATCRRGGYRCACRCTRPMQFFRSSSQFAAAVQLSSPKWTCPQVTSPHRAQRRSAHAGGRARAHRARDDHGVGEHLVPIFTEMPRGAWLSPSAGRPAPEAGTKVGLCGALLLRGFSGAWKYSQSQHPEGFVASSSDPPARKPSTNGLPSVTCMGAWTPRMSCEAS